MIYLKLFIIGLLTSPILWVSTGGFYRDKEESKLMLFCTVIYVLFITLLPKLLPV